jgi:hypothetical protein
VDIPNGVPDVFKPFVGLGSRIFDMKECVTEADRVSGAPVGPLVSPSTARSSRVTRSGDIGAAVTRRANRWRSKGPPVETVVAAVGLPGGEEHEGPADAPSKTPPPPKPAAGTSVALTQEKGTTVTAGSARMVGNSGGSTGTFVGVRLESMRMGAGQKGPMTSGTAPVGETTPTRPAFAGDGAVGSPETDAWEGPDDTRETPLFVLARRR